MASCSSNFLRTRQMLMHETTCIITILGFHIQPVFFRYRHFKHSKWSIKEWKHCDRLFTWYRIQKLACHALWLKGWNVDRNFFNESDKIKTKHKIGSFTETQTPITLKVKLFWESGARKQQEVNTGSDTCMSSVLVIIKKKSWSKQAKLHITICHRCNVKMLKQKLFQRTSNNRYFELGESFH